MGRISRLDKLVEIAPDQKIYFVSDFHLGAPNPEESLKREKRIVKWLEHCRKDAAVIFFVGDIFDFWFEYKHVIPKGFIRFQGKLAELTDEGIPVFLFTGNHDLWYKDYFSNELNIQLFTHPISVTINNKRFLVGHGDGLGEGDHVFKVLKRVFTSSLSQWLFKWIHPDIGISLARFWSNASRTKNHKKDDVFLGEEEVLFKYAREMEQKEHHDFYIFGHRHLPLELEISEKATYFNLGEWFNAKTYLEFDGEKACLHHFNPES